jgi:hypothetical protein
VRGEEKTCTHGSLSSIVCAGCGAQRGAGEPSWHCLGRARPRVIEAEASIDTRRRRSVRVEVPLTRPLWYAKILISVRSYASNGEPWTPPSIGLQTGGSEAFQVDDWPAVRDGIERALEAFRKLVEDADAGEAEGAIRELP